MIEEEPLRPRAAYRPFGAFRFMLAMLVVVSHTHVLAGRGDVLMPYGLGNLGVMSFFVLSGFVIAEAVAIFYPTRPGAFIVNRILRIHPPFFVALFFSVLLHRLASLSGPLRFFDPQEHVDRMFSAGNVAANALSMVIPAGLGRLGFVADYIFVRYSWAIAVELVFYYIVALLLAGAVIFAGGFGRSMWFWGSAASVVLAVHVVFMRAGLTAAFFVPWIPYFMLGMAMYQLSAGATGPHRTGLLLLAGISLVLVNVHAYSYMARNPHSRAMFNVAMLDLLLAATWILGHATISKRFAAFDRFAGDLTYPLYLNHFAVSIVAVSLLPEAWLGLPVFFAYLVVAIGFSYLAMQCTEPLTRQLRERIRGQKLA